MIKSIASFGTAVAAAFTAFYSQAAFSQDYKVHILKEGETLSELLWKEDYKPLYGEDRWVEKILKANHLTAEQAKDIKKGRPIILPSKEILRRMDSVELSQAAVSHGLFGNKISNHQDIEVGFQYHMNTLRTSESKFSSQENYGLFLNYQDNNVRSFKGRLYRPQIEAGIISHGTNRSETDKVVSYEPSFKLNSQVSFREPASTFSYGPSLSWETASRAFSTADGVAIRRDHLLWSGGFLSKTFTIPGGVVLDARASLEAALFNQEPNGEDPLNAIKNEMSLEMNLTKDYFLRVFSYFETYSNEKLDNATAAGARLSYQIN